MFRYLKHIKYIVLVLGGMTLLLASVLFYTAQEFDQQSVETSGVVTELVYKTVGSKPGYAPAIRFYTKQGRMIDFVSSKAHVTSKYELGDEVTILYNQKEPTDAVVKGFFSVWGASIAFGLVGCILFFLGCLLVVREKRKAKKIKQLLSSGTAVQANITHIGLDTSYKVGDTNPFQIQAQWLDPATQSVHVFKSEHIWYDPSDHIVKDSIRVYIDRVNPKKYYMDISFLPKLAE